MNHVDELRAAAKILRDPVNNLNNPLAQPLADLLDAEADGWPPPPIHTSTEPAARRRKAALALARTVNGTEP